MYARFQSEADENWARVERESKARSAATATARPRITPARSNVDLDAAHVEAPSAPDGDEDDVAEVFCDFSDDEVEDQDAKRARLDRNNKALARKRREKKAKEEGAKEEKAAGTSGQYV